MKNIKLGLLVLVSMIGLGSFGGVFADDEYLNREQFLTSYVTTAVQELGSGNVANLSGDYKDIILHYRGLRKNTPMYDIMQKSVYYDIFPNGFITLPLRKTVTEDQACLIIRSKFTISALCDKGQGVTSDWLEDIFSQMEYTVHEPLIDIRLTEDGYLDDSSLNQIYDVLNSGGNKDSVYDAIQGLVESINDPYTVFFQPTEAQVFNIGMKGEFEGIGAYVDILVPGVLTITSPIVGSPAQDAGLRAGDRILKIDDHRVTKDVDVTTAAHWIKGPRGTKVRLIVLREKRILNFTITRGTIIVKNISAKIYTGTCYMSIGLFGYGVYNEFVDALNNPFAGDVCNKYIFDVRNNPGGSLEEVADMLNYFVPTGLPTVVIDSKWGEEKFVSDNVSGKKLNDKKITILVNQGSASASEIFAGTIKDYVPSATLIGDTTYGKGSVQELIQYTDGSMLKYTIAKWSTGKTKTAIDHKGLNPDIRISDDSKTVEDEQLEMALRN